MSSRVSGFHKLSLSERVEWVKNFAALTEEETGLLRNFGGLGADIADRMIENAIGVMEIPLGLALNFLINGKDVVVPMVTEESSVVAAASHAAKLAREGGGFVTTITRSLMFSQIQLTGIRDPYATRVKIIDHKQEILDQANWQDPILKELGGGAEDIEVRVIENADTPMVVTHLIVNTLDAMGANAVNTMAESVAPLIEQLTGGRVHLRIISNLADKRLVQALTTIPKNALGGEEVVEDIILAYSLAAADPYRAATHNKGIMNGVSAVILATGNDARAIEAGAHAYAARFGRYASLTTWEKNSEGDLAGTLEMPMAVGIIGGATAVHPKARLALKIMGVTKAHELAEIAVSVGLAQNLAALRALATEGIQKGHMRLHAKNIAMMVGAQHDEVESVVERMLDEGRVRMDRAREIVASLRCPAKPS